MVDKNKVGYGRGGGIDVLIGGMRKGISYVSRERRYGAEINSI